MVSIHGHDHRGHGRPDRPYWLGEFAFDLLDGEDDQDIRYLPRPRSHHLLHRSSGQDRTQAQRQLRLHQR